MSPYFKFRTPGSLSPIEGNLDAIIKFHEGEANNTKIVPPLTDEKRNELLKVGTLPDADVSPMMDFSILSPVTNGIPHSDAGIPTNSSMVAGGGNFAANKHTPAVINIDNSTNNTQVVDKPLNSRPTTFGFEPNMGRDGSGRAPQHH